MDQRATTRSQVKAPTRSLLDEDRERAHYFALGAMVQYNVTDFDVLYLIATMFAYYYTHDGNMAKGLNGAWHDYVSELEQYAHDVYMSERQVGESQ